MSTITYTIPNISCEHCVHTIKMELGEIEGVLQVQANQSDRLVSIQYEPPATPEEIETLLTEINYPPAA